MNQTKLVLVFAVILLGFGVGILLYRQIPVVPWSNPTDGPFATKQSEVRPGDKLEWVSRLCRNTDNNYIVTRYIENLETHVRVPIDEVDPNRNLKKGECTAEPGSLRSVIIPLHVTPGLSAEVTKITTFRFGEPIDNEFRTQPFMVVR